MGSRTIPQKQGNLKALQTHVLFLQQQLQELASTISLRLIFTYYPKDNLNDSNDPGGAYHRNSQSVIACEGLN